VAKDSSVYATCFCACHVPVVPAHTFSSCSGASAYCFGFVSRCCAHNRRLLSGELLTYLWRIVTSDAAVTQLSVTSSGMRECCHGDKDHALILIPSLRDIVLHLPMLYQLWRRFLPRPPYCGVTRDSEIWTTFRPQFMWMTWPQLLQRQFSNRYGIKSFVYVLQNPGKREVLSET
jgi:hypothetical protein